MIMNVEQSSFSRVVLNVSRLVGIKEIIGSKVFSELRFNNTALHLLPSSCLSLDFNKRQLRWNLDGEHCSSIICFNRSLRLMFLHVVSTTKLGNYTLRAHLVFASINIGLLGIILIVSPVRSWHCDLCLSLALPQHSCGSNCVSLASVSSLLHRSCVLTTSLLTTYTSGDCRTWCAVVV